ncbi:hypothetical protein [Synechococcus sp. C9]|uniref:hypothetical protein n=1 Tax=Synechococcus sp. C9 TaxID=102119 RepID=UPI001FF259D6|nr:hypothetical protein [Synechococcus sp. C9]
MMGSTQIKITGSESGKKLTLVGLERMDGIGRIFATFWFFIIGFILAYVIFFTDLEYYLKYQYSVFIGQSDLAEKLVTPIMVILISLAFTLMLISYLIWQWLGNYISEQLGITGFARLALEVWLLDKIPTFGGVLLLLLSWPLSKFILAPVGASFLKPPTGFPLYVIGYFLMFFLPAGLLLFICFSLIVCAYTATYTYEFVKGAGELTFHFQAWFPGLVKIEKDPHRDYFNFVPIWNYRSEVYEWSLSAIRSVHAYGNQPTLALAIGGETVYLPLVKHPHRRACAETLAQLGEWLGVPQGQDIDGRTAKERVQVPGDAVQGIRRRMLPQQSEAKEDNVLALLVASALTMGNRYYEKRLINQTDDPALLFKAGIANLAAEKRDKAIQQFEQAKTLSEKKFHLTLQNLTQRCLKSAKQRR